MWLFDRSDYYQQVEILRRCTAEALKDPEFIWEREFIWNEELEFALTQSFKTLEGITAIAYRLNCPEPEIMRKIREPGLYEHFSELEILPGDMRAVRIAQMRSETTHFEGAPVVLSEERRNALFWLFCAGEDITEIALVLDCPETVVMQYILEHNLYHALSEFSLFEYCSEWNRTTFKKV